MRAKRRPRQVVDVLLAHPDIDDAIAKIVLHLATLPPERVQELERWLHVAPDLLPLIEDMWRRLLIDPPYVALMKEHVSVLAHHPIPTSPKSKGSTPKRRARHGWPGRWPGLFVEVRHYAALVR